jgi:hypothetical protein
MSAEELLSGPPVLIQYEGTTGTLIQNKHVRLSDGVVDESNEDTEMTEGERVMYEQNEKLDDAAERYLKAHKIPYSKVNGIYIIERYQQARSTTRKKYPNIMLRKELNEYKSKQQSMNDLKARVATDLRDRSKPVVMEEVREIERVSQPGLSTLERVELGYLLEYVKKTRDLWDKEEEVVDESEVWEKRLGWNTYWI